MTFNFLRGPTSGHFDVSRMAWAMGVLSAIGFTGYQLYVTHAFDITAFGTGFTLIMAGGGGATALKDTAVAKAVASSPADAL